MIEERVASLAPFSVEKQWREGIFGYWTETFNADPSISREI